MNLDELISKYLDGDLTEDEKSQFTKTLSEDGRAREKFDSAMSLHIAFREDAESINPPKKLIDQTEDLIMMKIFAKAPENKKRKPLLWLNPQMIAAAIVLLIFVFIFEIDQNINSSNTKSTVNQNIAYKVFNEQSEKEFQSKKDFRELQQTSTIQSNQMVKRTKRQLTSLNEINVVDKNISNGNNDLMNNALAFRSQELSSINPEQKVLKNESNDLVQTNEFKENPKNNILAFKTNLNDNKIINFNDLSQITIANNEENINQKKGQSISLSSFLGTDIVRGGMTNDNSMISHFSQAVSYEIDDDESFGFEVGFSQYAYDEKAEITVKKNIGNLPTNSSIESNESGIDFSIAYPQIVNVKSNTQILWASAFYERLLYEIGEMDFVTRIGAGFSNDGLIGYSKIFMQYQLFSGVKFTIGAEGRLFQAQINKFVDQKSNIKSSATLIYGLQFTF